MELRLINESDPPAHKIWSRRLGYNEKTGSNHTLYKWSTLYFTRCKSCHIYAGVRGNWVGLSGVDSVPIILVPLSLVVSRTLVSLPFLTGVG